VRGCQKHQRALSVRRSGVSISLYEASHWSCPWCLALARLKRVFGIFGGQHRVREVRSAQLFPVLVIIETLTMKQKQTPPNKRPYPIPPCPNQANPKAPRIYVIQELKHRKNSPNLVIFASFNGRTYQTVHPGSTGSEADSSRH
jgi:hypothetical protein